MAHAFNFFLISLAAVLAVGDLPARAAAIDTPSLRDGQHDFDWEFGNWKTNVRVLRNPLSGAQPNWAEYQGTSIVRPVAAGHYNLVELSVSGAAGSIEGAALRLYRPQAHQWTLNFANVRDGLLTAPVIGSFDGHGRGTFYADDTLDGRPIKVRFIITAESEGHAHFEQAFSADGGATWELNWIADDSRMASSTRATGLTTK